MLTFSVSHTLTCTWTPWILHGNTNVIAHKALIQWLAAHFMEHSNEPEPGTGATHTSARGVFMSTRMPVVLQHKGHSRTVVGVEFTVAGETNLLIYDPAR